ncbi:OadG family protein [Anaerosalibacter sp. Marseille-P3206]|uniref:OadG family protein n=1 Tax=Anaerosalibacter sp. Marseille-P3206 TaxID=1871005 RepID=UPI00098688B9|nr:OadG family protein [Anaerosalibacter sp. Marseille-P3206]
MLGDSVTFGQSLIVTVFSMAIVFLSLLIISYIIDALRAVATKDKGVKVNENKAPVKVAKEEIVEISKDEEDDDEELVAVIAAAIAASMGVNVSDLNIKSIKRIPQGGPVWSRIGRQEQISNRL